MERSFDVAVIGAGIAGLTAAALLQHDGAQVLLLEAHDKPGGCAGYFSIRDFTFDAGATVALGFEQGGLHRCVFEYLGVNAPAQLIDGLRMLLPDRELMIWHDAAKWRAARRALPGHRLAQEIFWHLQETVADASWAALSRLPSLPLQTSRDWTRNLRLLNPRLAPLAPFLGSTVGDVLRWLKLDRDRAFVAVLNLLLIITAQAEAPRVPFINGCAGIDLFRHGGYHLRGGMGAIARYLLAAFERDGGVARLGEPVRRIVPQTGQGSARSFVIHSANGEYTARRVVANVPLQNVAALMDLPQRTARNLQKHEVRCVEGWGAVTLYAAIHEEVVPPNAPLHQQVLLDYAARPGDGRDVFLSCSAPGDESQAPAGWRTLTASTHTHLDKWRDLSPLEYRAHKREWRERLLRGVRHALPDFDTGRKFVITGTPQTWADYTLRPAGTVGGVPLTLSSTNLHAIPQRLGLRHFWVVGDSTFPGQGTVACALSGINAWRDITGQRGLP